MEMKDWENNRWVNLVGRGWFLPPDMPRSSTSIAFITNHLAASLSFEARRPEHRSLAY